MVIIVRRVVDRPPLKTKKIMMNNVSKSAALLNAQSVMSAAVLFGHGDLVSLTCDHYNIELMLYYSDANAVYEREMIWLSDRFMCGCSVWKVEDSEAHTFSIFVSWEFNPKLR